MLSAGLVFEGEVGIEKKSVIRRYRFEPQDHPFGPGDKAHDTFDGKFAGEVVDVDEVARHDRPQAGGRLGVRPSARPDATGSRSTRRQ